MDDDAKTTRVMDGFVAAASSTFVTSLTEGRITPGLSVTTIFPD